MSGEPVSYHSDDAVIAAALKILARRVRKGAKIDSPASMRQFLQLTLGERPAEVFGAVFLSSQHRVIEIAELFQGTADSASVHPRGVARKALDVNAAAVVLYHNHPSGVSEPSQSDEVITRRLKEVLALFDVRVLDHLVVCAGEIYSFAENGKI